MTLARACLAALVLVLGIGACGPNDVGERIERRCARTNAPGSDEFGDCYSRQWDEHLEDMLHPKPPQPGSNYP